MSPSGATAATRAGSHPPTTKASAMAAPPLLKPVATGIDHPPGIPDARHTKRNAADVIEDSGIRSAGRLTAGRLDVDREVVRRRFGRVPIQGRCAQLGE